MGKHGTSSGSTGRDGSSSMAPWSGASGSRPADNNRAVFFNSTPSFDTSEAGRRPGPTQLPNQNQMDVDTSTSTRREAERDREVIVINDDTEPQAQPTQRSTTTIMAVTSGSGGPAPNILLSLPRIDGSVIGKKRKRTSTSTVLDGVDKRFLLDQYVSERQNTANLQLQNKISQLERQLQEKERVSQEAEKIHLETLALAESHHREEVLKEIVRMLQDEFNCCICNEVYIEPAVLNCGHTFCSYCINRALQQDFLCPFCRTGYNFNPPAKNVEMRNFIAKLYSVFPEDVRVARDQVVEERAALPPLEPMSANNANAQRRLQRAQRSRSISPTISSIFRDMGNELEFDIQSDTEPESEDYHNNYLHTLDRMNLFEREMRSSPLTGVRPFDPEVRAGSPTPTQRYSSRMRLLEGLNLRRRVSPRSSPTRGRRLMMEALELEESDASRSIARNTNSSNSVGSRRRLLPLPVPASPRSPSPIISPRRMAESPAARFTRNSLRSRLSRRRMALSPRPPSPIPPTINRIPDTIIAEATRSRSTGNRNNPSGSNNDTPAPPAAPVVSGERMRLVREFMLHLQSHGDAAASTNTRTASASATSSNPNRSSSSASATTTANTNTARARSGGVSNSVSSSTADSVTRREAQSSSAGRERRRIPVLTFDYNHGCPPPGPGVGGSSAGHPHPHPHPCFFDMRAGGRRLSPVEVVDDSSNENETEDDSNPNNPDHPFFIEDVDTETSDSD